MSSDKPLHRRQGVRLELTPDELDRIVELMYEQRGGQQANDRKLAIKLYAAQRRSGKLD